MRKAAEGIDRGREEHRETEASTKALELEEKLNETYEMHMQRAAQATKMLNYKTTL